MREEDLEKYSLDHLVNIAREYQLIEGVRSEKDELVILTEGQQMILPHEVGLRFMRAIVRAWIIGGKTIPTG